MADKLTRKQKAMADDVSRAITDALFAAKDQGFDAKDIYCVMFGCLKSVLSQTGSEASRLAAWSSSEMAKLSDELYFGSMH
jgi:hypothetical protein